MRRRHYWIMGLVLVGLCFSLTLKPMINRAVATVPVGQVSPYQQEKQGGEFYTQENWQKALEIWQEAFENYQAKGNSVDQGRVLSKLALAYAQLGQWEAAHNTIQESLRILKSEESGDNLAQAFNNQGILYLNQGNAQQALLSWEQAETLYRQQDNASGKVRAQINQAKALQMLGYYPRACDQVLEALNVNQIACREISPEDVRKLWENLPQSLSDLDISALLALSDLLRTLGQFEESLLITAQLEQALPSQQFQGILWLNAGKTLQLQNNGSGAIAAYQRAFQETTDNLVKLDSQLLQMGFLIKNKKYDEAITLIPSTKALLSQLQLSQIQITHQLNFIANLIRLKTLANVAPETLPSWEEISKLSQENWENTKKIGNQRDQAYALGLLGRIYEKNQQWQLAQQLTNQALFLSQTLNAPEMVYLWEWQLGRIWRGQQEREKAIEVYLQAINIHSRISGEIAANQEAQFAFQERGENLYREAVSFLLQPDENGQIAQEDLRRALNVMEKLQVAELNNFFRDICTDLTSTDIENIDPHAAIVYPMILNDRLGIIVSIDRQPLNYYEIRQPRAEIEKTIEAFRNSIVVRSRREFIEPGATLYDWLIRPAIATLNAHQIKTLVFVLDGNLRNIPMGALVDTQVSTDNPSKPYQYLIEQYQVALTPGLQLFPSQPSLRESLKVLAGGLTEAQGDAIPLEYVEKELNVLKQYISPNSVILRNEEFTAQRLQEEILNNPFPIVHLASHGFFSANLDNTYIQTWNGVITIRALGNLLQLSQLIRTQAIELLVLSACETATGDQRAALGLAGVAVRSGARSTLATLWSVNDQATAELMGQFYRSLTQKDSVSVAQALQEAQLKLLQDRWYEHPFYWAPYILVGNWL